jgi:hypothetical protein
MRGGYVHSPADPHASAICIEDDHVVWVGDDNASSNFADGATTVIDLQGRLVTPAFVDSHAHLGQTGLDLAAIDLSGAPSLSEALRMVADHARSTELPVVLAFGWDETSWPEARIPTLAEVDGAVAGKPAYLSRVDLHSALVSSAFLDRVPSVLSAEGYSHGRVERDAHHVVRQALLALVPDRTPTLLAGLRHAASQGIALVHEMGAPHISPLSDFGAIRELSEQYVLPETVGYWGAQDDIPGAVQAGCVGVAGDLCADGALGSRTAALLQPYADADSRGHLYLEPVQMAAHIVDATRAGLQAGFHVIGDAAAAAVVEAFLAAEREVGVQALLQSRHRLEHVEMVDAEQIATLGRLGVTASVQPMFDALWGHPDGMYERRLGRERAYGLNPFASMARAGMSLAFGSDSPVTPFGPWAAVRAAMSHHNPDQRLTARAAFNAHTRGGWRAAGLDDGGVIAPGASASVAVWEVESSLEVQTPDERIASWSTDARAGVPLLPTLNEDSPLPTCTTTLVRGRAAYDRDGELA